MAKKKLNIAQKYCWEVWCRLLRFNTEKILEATLNPFGNEDAFDQLDLKPLSYIGVWVSGKNIGRSEDSQGVYVRLQFKNREAVVMVQAGPSYMKEEARFIPFGENGALEKVLAEYGLMLDEKSPVPDDFPTNPPFGWSFGKV